DVLNVRRVGANDPGITRQLGQRLGNQHQLVFRKWKLRQGPRGLRTVERENDAPTLAGRKPEQTCRRRRPIADARGRTASVDVVTPVVERTAKLVADDVTTRK